MSASACPSPETLSKVVSIGPDEALSAHISSCERCSALLEAESSLINLFKAAPYEEPPAEQVSQVRASLLQQASQMAPASQLSWGRLALAAIVLLAVGAFLAVSWNKVAPGIISNPKNNGDAPTQEKTIAQHLGTVGASPEARFTYQGNKQDEIVRLQEGTISVEVKHLSPGERFRVVTGDAEVEVRGTSFEVTAKDDKLVQVVVHSGKVEVRPQGKLVQTLFPSESWDVKTAKLSPATTLAASTPTEDPKKNDPKESNTPTKSPAEELFSEGYASLSDKDFEKAAAQFSQAFTLDPKSAIAEDARYFYAVALLSAGKREEAKKALITFTARYPNSPRHGEASASLGLMYLEEGALDDAQIRFESALDNQSAEVRKTAQDGLAEIKRRRATQPPTP